MGQVEIVERRMIEKLMRSWVGKQVTIAADYKSTVSLQIEGELTSTSYGWYLLKGKGSSTTFISFGEKHVEDAWDGSYGDGVTYQEKRMIRVRFYSWTESE